MELTVIDWNGSETPHALRDLPPGKYVLQPLSESSVLTAAEDEGLRAALNSLDTGQ